MKREDNQILVTAGELAKLSQTTKRTVQWYTQAGLIRPVSVRTNGYRFYSIEQIIDLQVVMLLRRLDFSLEEIKKLTKTNTSWKKLFLSKKSEITQEISRLQKSLGDIDQFYQNLDKNSLLINPKIKTVPSFEMFYIEKTGPYSKIYEYGLELKSYFSNIPKNATYFVLFPESGYKPHKDQFKVGVVIKGEMKLKKEAKEVVKKSNIPAFKALSYEFVGSPSLISMVIMQMREFKEKTGLEYDLSQSISEIEFYIRSGLNDYHDENTMISEINIPVK